MSPVKGLPAARKTGSVTLYDGGGWFAVVIFLGIPAFFGSLIDYGWNFLVLHLTLKRLSLRIKAARKLIYSLFITIIGFAIDWVYYQTFWGYAWRDSNIYGPLFSEHNSHPCLELSTILAPMLLLALANYVLSRLYLKLEVGQAVILSAVMGVFTAPWIVVITVIVTHYY